VADRVHAAVKAVKATVASPPVDAGVRQAALEQLRRRQDAVITLSELRNPAVRERLLSHRESKSSRGQNLAPSLPNSTPSAPR
jgi:hypothetical protein